MAILRMSITLERLEHRHAPRFLAAVAKSRALHAHWVSPPQTPNAFRAYIEKYHSDRNISYVAAQATGDLVGCLNLSEIFRGSFQSAYLGFYAFVPFAGQGLMRQAMQLVLTEAFTTLGLHRLEANIQPTNARSKRLVESLGFRCEGFSPRYLQIAGLWRDHERYAITVEEWNA